MKKIILSIAASIIFATSVVAQESGSIQVKGRVIDKQPIYTKVSRPVQECHYEYRNSNNTGDALTGAIIGGAIGNQFGAGSGKDAMTVLGAILGAQTATKNSNTIQVEVCNNVYQTVSVANEVDVVFESAGQQFTIRLNATHADSFRIGDRVDFRLRFQMLN